MAIVRHVAGRELTPEKEAALRAQVRAAAKRPYTYDPDCPLLTPEQLAEFRPVNFATMEERAQAMRERGITAAEGTAEYLPENKGERVSPSAVAG